MLSFSLTDMVSCCAAPGSWRYAAADRPALRQSDRGRGTPVTLPGAVARQGEPAYLVDAVDHDEHIDLILREQSHREAAYRRVEPVPIHRRGAVGQIPLHAARRLEQAELREPREELLVMVQSQRLAYRQQSGHRIQAVHLHGLRVWYIQSQFSQVMSLSCA